MLTLTRDMSLTSVGDWVDGYIAQREPLSLSTPNFFEDPASPHAEDVVVAILLAPEDKSYAEYAMTRAVSDPGQPVRLLTFSAKLAYSPEMSLEDLDLGLILNNNLRWVEELRSVRGTFLDLPSDPAEQPARTPAGMSTAETEEAFARIAAQEAELNELRAELAAAHSPAEAERLATRNAQLTEQFYASLIDFLNSGQMPQGAPPTDMEWAVLRRKSYEDMRNAQEWIDEGGDYATAISILEAAVGLDPEFEDLRNMLDWAVANRYTSEEKFRAVAIGMSPDQVRSVLGQVNPRFVREFPDRGVVGWFYPTGESGSAASVWFKEGPAGQLVVCQADFDAVLGAPR